MICLKCGKEVVDSLDYCPYCTSYLDKKNNPTYNQTTNNVNFTEITPIDNNNDLNVQKKASSFTENILSIFIIIGTLSAIILITAVFFIKKRPSQFYIIYPFSISSCGSLAITSAFIGSKYFPNNKLFQTFKFIFIILFVLVFIASIIFLVGCCNEISKCGWMG